MSEKQPDQGEKVVKRSLIAALLGFLFAGPAGAAIGLGLGVATSSDKASDQKISK
jgi:ABC-type nitrate/sulfonate/bicarbonate transport system permease component